MPATLGLIRPIQDEGPLPRQAALRLIGIAGLLTAPIGHRLFWRFCRLLSRGFRDSSAIIRVGEESHIKIDLRDPYWLRLVARAYSYEGEIAYLLHRFRDLPFTFVDCGANLGYWSILASGPEFGSHPTVAIEASARTCEALEENCRLNGRRFRVVHAAVAETSGKVAWFGTGNDQASASLYNVAGPITVREEVTTLALDDLGIASMALIKLDVEGAEVEAIRGARELLKGETLLCYEDHGADPTCAPTRLALDLGLCVFWSTPNGNIRPIRDIETVRRIKTRRRYGYNFIACQQRSAFANRLDPSIIATTSGL